MRWVLFPGLPKKALPSNFQSFGSFSFSPPPTFPFLFSVFSRAKAFWGRLGSISGSTPVQSKSPVGIQSQFSQSVQISQPNQSVSHSPFFWLTKPTPPTLKLLVSKDQRVREGGGGGAAKKGKGRPKEMDRTELERKKEYVMKEPKGI